MRIHFLVTHVSVQCYPYIAKVCYITTTSVRCLSHLFTSLSKPANLTCISLPSIYPSYHPHLPCEYLSSATPAHPIELYPSPAQPSPASVCILLPLFRHPPHKIMNIVYDATKNRIDNLICSCLLSAQLHIIQLNVLINLYI